MILANKDRSKGYWESTKNFNFIKSNPKQLQELARAKINIDNKELNEELAQKLNPNLYKDKIFI